MSSSELLEAALAYARDGWHVFPCEPPTLGVDTSGKAPLTTNGKDDATTDPMRIRAWWHRWPDANIGLAVEPSNRIVLDVDVGEGKNGAASLREIDAELTDTRIARTGGNGLHIVYERGDKEPRQALHIRDGLDIIGNGYIIAAPSRHWSGGTYTWLNDKPIAPVPPIIHALKRIPKLNAHAAPSSTVHRPPPEKNARIVAAGLLADAWPDRGRHFAFLALAGALATEGWSEETITEFTTMVARLMSGCDEKAIADREPQARDSVAKVEAGEPVAGWGTLATLIPQETITRAIAKLGFDSPEDWAFVSEETHAARDALGDSAMAFLESTPPATPSKGFTLCEELACIDFPPVVSYATGFAELDALLGGGFSTQQLIVMLGKPGAGKTAFVIGRALHVETSVPVLYVSTELQHNEIVARLCSPILMVPWRDLVRGKAATQDGPVTAKERTAALAGKRIGVIGQDEIYRAGEKAVELIAKTAVRMREHFGISPVIVVDYMQELARGEESKQRTRNTAVAIAFRMLSQRLDASVVAVSSVSRAGYGASAQALRTSDDPTVYLALAKESGDIDYAAATIMFVDVAEEHDGTGWKPGRIAVSKSRHGDVGFAGVKFHGATGRWEPYSEGIRLMSADKQAESKAQKLQGEFESKVMGKVRELTTLGPESLLDKTGLKAAVGGNGQLVGTVIDRLIVERKLVKISQSFRDASNRMQRRDVIMLGDVVAASAAPGMEPTPSILEIVGPLGP